jgi:hypothetical protein
MFATILWGNAKAYLEKVQFLVPFSESAASGTPVLLVTAKIDRNRIFQEKSIFSFIPVM